MSPSLRFPLRVTYLVALALAGLLVLSGSAFGQRAPQPHAVWKTQTVAKAPVVATGTVKGPVRAQLGPQRRWKAAVQVRTVTRRVVRGKARSVTSWRTVATGQVKGKARTFRVVWPARGVHGTRVLRLRVMSGTRLVAAGRPATRRVTLPKAPVVPVAPGPVAPPAVPTPTAPAPTFTEPPSPVPPPPAPAPPTPVTVDTVELMRGSSVSVGLPQDVSVNEPHAVRAGGARFELAGGTLTVAAAMDAPLGSTSATATVEGCVAERCGVELTFTLTAAVTELSSASPSEPLEVFTVASEDRVAAAEPMPAPLAGGVLRDEVLVTVGSNDEPGRRAEADAAAGATGGHVTGGIDELGIYQLRWDTPQDLETLASALLAVDGVSGVDHSGVDTIDISSLAAAWDQLPDPAGTWHHLQLRTRQAWALQSSAKALGVIDSDYVALHRDLDVTRVDNETGFIIEARDARRYTPSNTHGTHVAGIACAKGTNTVDVIGTAGGCRVFSTAPRTGSDVAIIQSMHHLARLGVKTVNMSLASRLQGDMGIESRCTTRAEHDEFMRYMRNGAYNLRRDALERVIRSERGRKMVWVVAAGNSCAPGVYSPWGMMSSLHDNVLTVAATNGSGNLASFSNWGSNVDVAAPGGLVGTGGRPGILSTVGNDGLDSLMGTSMAAPAVAGVSLLVQAEHPDLNGDQVANCIRSTAGLGPSGYANARSASPETNGFGANYGVDYEPVPIVDALNAVRCDPFTDGTSPKAGRITAGNGHTCVLTPTQNVKCWGSNANGQIGRSPEDLPSSETARTINGVDDVYSINAGLNHTCAVYGPARQVRCWGSNGTLQLGHDGTGPAFPTALTIDGLTNVRSVAGGGMHTCALEMSGTVKCWGLGVFGQLGFGPLAGPAPFTSTPTTVTGITDAVGIAAGIHHSCAVTSTRQVHCWGDNTFGQLGDGTTTNRDRPVNVQGIDDAVSVHASEFQSCARHVSGRMSCWGDSGGAGWLGAEVDGIQPTPVTVTVRRAGNKEVASSEWLATGSRHGCFVDRDEFRCFGTFGELITTNEWPTPELIWVFSPQRVPNMPPPVAAAVGYHEICVLEKPHGVRCTQLDPVWGRIDITSWRRVAI